jgi:NAD(P)-dependent dehydrogenase (short-subunit alcohol dehydrogenase family)
LFADELTLEIVNNTILIRSFLPLIRKGTPGRLVFMSSVIGSIELAAGMPMLADAYAVSRGALNMLVRKWGGALKFEGIATALVHPGRHLLSTLFRNTPYRKNADIACIKDGSLVLRLEEVLKNG